MDYILRCPLNELDVEFLNNTVIEFELIGISRLDNNDTGYDSGWSDAGTGARIINNNDRVMFKNVSDEHLTFLTLKYNERIIEAHDGMKSIYNYTMSDR